MKKKRMKQISETIQTKKKREKKPAERMEKGLNYRRGKRKTSNYYSYQKNPEGHHATRYRVASHGGELLPRDRSTRRTEEILLRLNVGMKSSGRKPCTHKKETAYRKGKMGSGRYSKGKGTREEGKSERVGQQQPRLGSGGTRDVQRTILTHRGNRGIMWGVTER